MGRGGTKNNNIGDTRTGILLNHKWNSKRLRSTRRLPFCLATPVSAVKRQNPSNKTPGRPLQDPSKHGTTYKVIPWNPPPRQTIRRMCHDTGLQWLHGESLLHHPSSLTPLLGIANHGPHVGLLAGAGLAAHNATAATITTTLRADRERANREGP